MIKYDFVFVVLTYRNINDLRDFFASFKVPSAKVIVVNSFYDSNSDETFHQIALENSADYLSVPNKGYGAGNNRGCEYAIKKYSFKYLIISNADVQIKKMDITQLDGYEDCVVAPNIINLNGKRQNPNLPFNESKLISTLRFRSYKKRNKKAIKLLNIYCRLEKIIFYMITGNHSISRIFSAHGAFLIIGNGVFDKISQLYNEEMFLFNEERTLARRCRNAGISTVYNPNIQVLHKEDGSMSIANNNKFENLIQSFTVYYKEFFDETYTNK